MRYTTLPGTETPGVTAARRRGRRRALTALALLAVAFLLILINLARIASRAPSTLTWIQTCIAAAFLVAACIYLYRTRTRRTRASATTRKAPHV